MVLKHKITLEEWTKLGRRNYAPSWLRQFCSYTLVKDTGGKFKREQRLSWPAYCFMFIPLLILEALLCMWDGGLKDFELQERYLGGDYFTTENPVYDQVVATWTKHINKF